MRVEVETYGCAMNQGDTELMAGLLKEHGHQLVEKDGDVLVVNTCTVKTPTENKIRKRLGELQRQGRRIVVAGCLPAADQTVAEEFPEFCFIGVNSGDIAKAVEAAAAGKRVVLIGSPRMKVCIPKNRMNRLVEITPIAEGCLGSCSYCITRAARGKLKSFPLEKVVEHVKEAVNDGVGEVWLTAQDTGAYGLDSGSNLPELLREVAAIPGEFKIRVGMMNPNHVLGFLDELIEAYRNDKIYSFLHLPVQSGSDRILKDMNRKYCAEDFKLIVREFRKELGTTGTFNQVGACRCMHAPSGGAPPCGDKGASKVVSSVPCWGHAPSGGAPAARYHIKKLGTTISTDVIVGYPTETEQEFQETLKLIKETKPDIVNISRYWPRKGTKAAGMEQHPGRVTKQRSRLTNELFKKIGLKQNESWVGLEGPALVSEKNQDGSYTARNQQYKPIIIKSNRDILGKTVNVRIEKATYYDLRGKLISS